MYEFTECEQSSCCALCPRATAFSEFSAPCYKKISIQIPSEYIASGKVVNKYFDMGSLELAMKLKGQTTDCIN
ncbi:unnamed protein product [Strongylus vulgaris]|uniref:Uncharacterized protein n=1 Tax=Strongylus vulgaris TaxID=40348 RepID=A0A3P7JI38_STRVU|nr:unnamed protein product [Strongylus vulgaris]